MASTSAISRMTPARCCNFYRRLIAGATASSLRWWRANTGRCTKPADGYVAFLRTTETQTVLVLLNYSNARHDLRFDVPGKQTAHVRFSTGRNSGDLSLADLSLDAYEVLIAELI